MFLIFPKIVEIQRLNTDAQVVEQTVNASLRDLLAMNANDGSDRDDGRRYSDSIFLSAQIETGQSNALSVSPFGTTPTSDMALVFLMSDLVCHGLVNADGKPLLKTRDRLVAIRDEYGRTIQTFPDPPGMFFVEVTPSGYGFGSGAANLVVVTLEANPDGRTS